MKSISLFTVREWRTDIGAGYDTLDDNLSSFRSVGNEPLPIGIKMLDEGDIISNTLARNHAKWRSSCCLKCCASRVARIVLRLGLVKHLEGIIICATGYSQRDSYRRM